MAWTGGVIGRPSVVTFAFGNQSTLTVASSLGTQGDAHEFNNYQKDAWRLSMTMHSDASGVQFIEVTDASTANVVINYQTLADYTGLGWVNFPGTVSQVHIEVNARYYDQIESMDYNLGGSDLPVFMLHEIGHSLGMKHPFIGDVQLPDELNHRGYTVMSHTTNPDGTYRSDLSPLDRAALEYAYGTQADQEALPVQWCQLEGGGLVSIGNDENNTIVGISDRDLILAGSGNDTINSGSGDDTISAGDGTNYINGGLGLDVLSINTASTSADMKLFFSNNIGVSAAGRSGVIISNGEIDYFSGIEMFRFTDGNFALSESTINPAMSNLDVIGRLYSIIHGVAAPSNWLNQKITALNAGSSTLQKIAANEIKSSDWISIRGSDDNLPESVFSLIWNRAFHEQSNSEQYRDALIVHADSSLVLEMSMAPTSGDFLRTAFSREYASVPELIVEPVISEESRYSEVLTDGEATYGFRLVNSDTIISQRLHEEIAHVAREFGGINVSLNDGRTLLVPDVDKIRLIDGTLDFRSAGLQTYSERVFEFLAGRDMTLEEHARAEASTSGGAAGLAVKNLMLEQAIQSRYSALSDVNLARSLYRNLLDKEATSGEINSIKAAISAGRSNLDVVTDFVLRNDVIERLSSTSVNGIYLESGADKWVAVAYDAVFNRPLLTPARDNFAGPLELGGTVRSTILTFLNSPEAKDRYGEFSDREFIGIIYQNAYGAAQPDALIILLRQECRKALRGRTY